MIYLIEYNKLYFGGIMIMLRETTKSFPENVLHTYLLTDDKFKVLGYIKQGTTETIMFKKSLKFFTKGRTFIKVS